MNNWIEKHSVNCYFCGKLVDERNCMPADEFNDNDGGDICSVCVDKKAEEDICVDPVDKNYTFDFFSKTGEYLDTTSLVENNPTYALSLFVGEFGWNKEYEGYVKLMSWDDPSLFDDCDNFEMSCDVREDKRRTCTAPNHNKEDVAQLKTCPLYEDEEDADHSEGDNLTCRFCWAMGHCSVCEMKPKEIE